ncbi:hypothetical protein [Amphritea sp.]|uniref:hypothetical protein n=1 Tax=Amphritea sp. TaxID=1872502 RepID=UPI003D123AAD
MNEIYTPPKSEIDPKEEPKPRVSKTLWISAVFFSLLYMGVNVFFTLQLQPDQGSVVGAVLACLIWPLIVVGIVSIWKKNRNSRSRVKAFLFTTIFFLGVAIAANTLLPKYVEYNKQRNADSGAVAPSQVR